MRLKKWHVQHYRFVFDDTLAPSYVMCHVSSTTPRGGDILMKVRSKRNYALLSHARPLLVCHCWQGAMEANPFVAAFVGWNEAFQEIVDPEKDAEEPGARKGGGSSSEQDGTGVLVAEALQYCITDIMMWSDAEGAVDWMCEEVSESSPSLEGVLMDPLETDEEEDGNEVDEGSSAETKALALYRAVYSRDVELRDDEEDDDREGESSDGLDGEEED